MLYNCSEKNFGWWSNFWKKKNIHGRIRHFVVELIRPLRVGSNYSASGVEFDPWGVESALLGSNSGCHSMTLHAGVEFLSLWGRISPLRGRIWPCWVEFRKWRMDPSGWGRIGPSWGRIRPLWGRIQGSNRTPRLGSNWTRLGSNWTPMGSNSGVQLDPDPGVEFDPAGGRIWQGWGRIGPLWGRIQGSNWTPRLGSN
jgi:hypothetical protein